MAYTVTSGTLFAEHSERIEEVINKNVDVILPTLDPAWRDTFVTSQNVGPADAIGRDMVIIKVFQGSFTGVLEQAAPRDDFVLFGDDVSDWGAKMYGQTLTQTFPDPRSGPNAAPYRLAVPMRAMVSNIMFTLGELQAEATAAFIGEVISPKLEGFARNISHTLCNYWYVNGNSNYVLANLSNASTGWTGTGPWTMTFEPDNQACDRFWVGQRVDIIDEGTDDRMNDTAAPNAQTTATRVQLLVAAVDELTNTVTLITDVDPTTGGGVWNNAGDYDAPVNGDHVTYGNSLFDAATAVGTATGISGIRQWLVNSGNLNAPDDIAADAVDVDVHPEHKSAAFDMANGVMTEHKLRQRLRRFHAAKTRYGQYIDCLIASDGVWLAYEATKIGRELLDRTGRLSSLKTEGSDNDANYGGFSFTFDGRTYMGYTSCYIENNTMYGIRKGGGNWKRYVPPDPRGVTTFDRADAFVPFRFVAGAITGTGSNRLPLYDSNNTGNISMVTEGSQMPGMLRMQLVPDQPAGIVFSNVGEDRVYSS
jgi:hypothetical protein